MKEAGTHAMLFCILMIAVLGMLAIVAFIVMGGKTDGIDNLWTDIKTQGTKFLHWNFPKLADQGLGNEL